MSSGHLPAWHAQTETEDSTDNLAVADRGNRGVGLGLSNVPRDGRDGESVLAGCALSRDEVAGLHEWLGAWLAAHP